MEPASGMPAPWEFADDNPLLVSPDGRARLAYEDLEEIAMGGPLVGKLFLVYYDVRFFISARAGCPALWDPTSTRAVFPAWTENSPTHGTMQRLALLDLSNRRVSYSVQRFHVLDIKSFDGERIAGTDSPICHPGEFDIAVSTMSVLDRPPPGSVDYLQRADTGATR